MPAATGLIAVGIAAVSLAALAVGTTTASPADASAATSGVPAAPQPASAAPAVMGAGAVPLAPAAPAPPTAAPSPPPADAAARDLAGDSPAESVELATSADGFLVVRAPTHRTYGANKLAPVTTYSVEVHKLLRGRAGQLSAGVATALGDPTRGWTAHGEHRLRQVSDPAKARVRIVLAPAGVVNAYCTRVGLPTGGLYSCWDGRRTMLNAMRWRTGAPWFSTIESYRSYLVNHEFGHALGKQHQNCPRPGAISPLMVQQSKSTYGCRANSWPYPKSRSSGA